MSDGARANGQLSAPSDGQEGHGDDSNNCCRNLVAFKRRRKRRRRPEERENIPFHDDPFRRRCLRALIIGVYWLLAIIAVIVTFAMIHDLVTSMNNPVRSIHYMTVKDYVAPGIAVFPGGADFLACGQYYDNVVTSKVRLTQLDLLHTNCSHVQISYYDSATSRKRDVIVFRGPTSVERREAVFLHFSLEDETRDFFTVSYFVFPRFDQFSESPEESQVGQLKDYLRYVPTFALSSGLRMWIKLIMSEAYLMDGTMRTAFNVEYSVVRFWDRRPENETRKHLFFIFFEWKGDVIEQSHLLYTTTPWRIGAGLCAVFLMLHRGYQLAQTSYRKAQKEKQRRSLRRQTIRELKRQRTIEATVTPSETSHSIV